jgi:hypothetical protein
MRPAALLLLTATTCLTSGCATGPLTPATPTAALAGEAICEAPSYSKQDLSFRCGAATYDLLQEPVRSERVFDIVTREAFTRRYYVTRLGGRRLAYKTVQLQGERHPRKVMLETQQGFRRVLLDLQGNVILADRALELGQ